MAKAKNITSCYVILFTIFSFTVNSQNVENPTLPQNQKEVKELKPNVIRFNPTFTGYHGLGYKFNYERNITSKFSLYGSYTQHGNFGNSFGLGYKSQIFTKGKFASLIGLEFQRNFNNNERLKLPNTKSWGIELNAEMRYSFAKNFFLNADVFTLYNFKDKDNRSGFRLGVGMRF